MLPVLWVLSEICDRLASVADWTPCEHCSPTSTDVGDPGVGRARRTGRRAPALRIRAQRVLEGRSERLARIHDRRRAGRRVRDLRSRRRNAGRRQAVSHSGGPIGRLRARPTSSVGCVKRKLMSRGARERPVRVAALSEGAGLRRAAGVPWFILSAQHGLVAPDEVLGRTTFDSEYDLPRLPPRLGSASRRAPLRELSGSLEGKTIEVHAGSAYADAIREGLRSEGAQVVEPLAGLALGPRLAWYGRPTRRRAASRAAPRPTSTT